MQHFSPTSRNLVIIVPGANWNVQHSLQLQAESEIPVSPEIQAPSVPLVRTDVFAPKPTTSCTNLHVRNVKFKRLQDAKWRYRNKESIAKSDSLQAEAPISGDK